MVLLENLVPVSSICSECGAGKEMRQKGFCLSYPKSHLWMPQCTGSLWGQVLPLLGPLSSMEGAPTPLSDPLETHMGLFANPSGSWQVPRDTQCSRQGQVRILPCSCDVLSLWDCPQTLRVPSVTSQGPPRCCPGYQPSWYFIWRCFGFTLLFYLLNGNSCRFCYKPFLQPRWISLPLKVAPTWYIPGQAQCCEAPALTLPQSSECPLTKPGPVSARFLSQAWSQSTLLRIHKQLHAFPRSCLWGLTVAVLQICSFLFCISLICSSL